MYLEKFMLPDEDKEYAIARKRMEQNGGGFGYLENGYPCGIFASKQLSQIDFDRVTILYGGNGSGKSTLLNLIAAKLQLNRVSPFNGSELFIPYTAACKYDLSFDDYGKKQKIPDSSMIITSDDVFDYMLAARTINEEINENIEDGRSDYAALKFGDTVQFNGLENYEEFRLQVLSRRKSLSRRKFLQKLAGKEIKLNSNGETALDYFENKLQNDTLFCLDEPENSLSVGFQMKLKEIIERKSRYCGCQFIIATHSPFVLATENAKIYNLDKIPVVINKWWEVESAKSYFDFFYRNRKLFSKEQD